MTAWGHLLAVTVPAENLILTSGTLLLCSSLICGGVTKPVLFEDIYMNKIIAIIAGLLSPSRFFTETLVVSDLICLPEQFGFTKSENSTFNHSGLDRIQLGQLDRTTISHQTCSGWYWGFVRVFLIGLSVRMISLLFVLCKHDRVTTGDKFSGLIASNFTFLLLTIATIGVLLTAILMIVT